MPLELEIITCATQPEVRLLRTHKSGHLSFGGVLVPRLKVHYRSFIRGGKVRVTEWSGVLFARLESSDFLCDYELLARTWPHGILLLPEHLLKIVTPDECLTITGTI